METLSCFKCDSDLVAGTTKCSRCSWNGGAALPESDDRYLVLVALIYRTIEEGVRVMPYINRVEGTARELAVLEHGDQCEIDGTKWRISGKNAEKGCFFLNGFRILHFPNRQFFKFEPEDPVEEIKEEMRRWKHLHSAYYEILELKKRRELRGYLRRPERKRAIYRAKIQDESPYLS
ncbi:MAG: hypothetical protein P1U89_09845 [Verrucomicrobiales bacterium]|nr:hypothetical protein [Verrucomicrobiales bacterium]